MSAADAAGTSRERPLARASRLLLVHAGCAALCLALGLVRSLMASTGLAHAEEGPGGRWLFAGALLLLLLPVTRNGALLWATRARRGQGPLRAWLVLGIALFALLYGWLLAGRS